MTSKQLGKLRQWAGEVISTNNKTLVSEEFKQREKEIELRKDGLQRLHIASETYLQTLSKKKDSGALDDAEKLMPIDTLGIVMIVHGEELSGTGTSHFSQSLIKLGRAHCRIATLQEAYTLTLRDTFITSLDKFMDDVREYEVQRKKLESRRLTLDSAITKAEKAKKDKGKQEAEEELARAQARYDEAEEDLHAYMKVVQDNEIEQQRELGALLDAELNFVQQYVSVLKDVKSDWQDGSILSRNKTRSGSSPVPTHVFNRSSSSNTKPKPKYSSVRSQRSTKSNQENDSGGSSDEDNVLDEEGALSRSRRPSAASRATISRPTTPSRRRTDSVGDASLAKSSPSISRPSSRSSRRKSVTEATEDKSTRRMSVANWMGSVSGKSKKKLESEDEGETAVDMDEGNSSPTKLSRSGSTSRRSTIMKMMPGHKSKESLSSSRTSSHVKSGSSISRPKLVKARHSFTSDKPDELSFRAGDKITVVSEVLDDWWMGDLNGVRGLFPTSYTEVLSDDVGAAAAEASKPPPLPRRSTVSTPIHRDSSTDDLGFHSFPDNHRDHDGDSDSLADEAIEEQESRGLFAPRTTSAPGLGKTGSFSSATSSSSRLAGPFAAVRRFGQENGFATPMGSSESSPAPSVHAGSSNINIARIPAMSSPAM